MIRARWILIALLLSGCFAERDRARHAEREKCQRIKDEVAQQLCHARQDAVEQRQDEALRNWAESRRKKSVTCNTRGSRTTCTED